MRCLAKNATLKINGAYWAVAARRMAPVDRLNERVSQLNLPDVVIPSIRRRVGYRRLRSRIRACRKTEKNLMRSVARLGRPEADTEKRCGAPSGGDET